MDTDNEVGAARKAQAEPFVTDRIQRAAWAFSIRRVPREAAHGLLTQPCMPLAGDLVLARVDSLGQHPGLQLPSGRRKQLFPGDEIVVAYGNRYASNQFEALVPQTLGPCHLAAGGGIAGRVVSWHVKMSKGPTQLTPIGLVCDAQGRRLNVADYALPPIGTLEGPLPPTIAVVGTGMDSGKTQTCAYIVRGLMAAGLRVGYGKVTGTGAGGDTWLLTDAGASPVLDFTDAGMATTYLASPEEVAGGLANIVGHIAKAGVDAMVLEIADGVLQVETAALLRSPVFDSLVSGVVMASQDSMGATAGVQWLRRYARRNALAVSGLISAAPLQAREAITQLGLPVYDRQGLADPQNAIDLLRRAQEQSTRVKARAKAGTGKRGDRREVKRNIKHAQGAGAGVATPGGPAPQEPQLRPDTGVRDLRAS